MPHSPKMPQWVPNSVITCSVFSDCNPPRFPLPGGAAHLDGEADNPVREQPTRVHEEVHHVGVVCVLHAAQTRFDHGESGLHEHDQKASDQGPDEVDRDLVLADLVGNIAQCEAGFGVANRHIVDGAGDYAAGIAVGQSGGGGRRCKRVSSTRQRTLKVERQPEPQSLRLPISSIARAQVQVAMRGNSHRFSSMIGLIIDCVERVRRKLEKKQSSFPDGVLAHCGRKHKEDSGKRDGKPHNRGHHSPAHAGRHVQSKEHKQPAPQHNGYANQFHHRRLRAASGLAFEGLDS